MFLHSLRCNTDVTKRSAADIQKLFLILFLTGWGEAGVWWKLKKENRNETKQNKEKNKQTLKQKSLSFNAGSLFNALSGNRMNVPDSWSWTWQTQLRQNISSVNVNYYPVSTIVELPRVGRIPVLPPPPPSSPPPPPPPPTLCCTRVGCF